MNPYLLPALELGPVIFERLLDHIPRSQLDVSLIEGRFTPREIMAHLADWEPIMRGRIETACLDPGSSLAVYDEGEMAIENEYSSSDIHEQCGIFRRERRITAELARSLTPEAWGQSVSHPERGMLTTEDLTNLLLGHDLYHIEQLSAYLPFPTGNHPQSDEQTTDELP